MTSAATAREIIERARLVAIIRVDDEALGSAAPRLGELVSPC